MASTGLSSPIPVLFSLQPEEPKSSLDQDPATLKTGLRAILKRIVDCQPLQLDQALEMVEDPFEVEVKRPFGEEISETANGQTVPPGGDRKRPAEGEGDEPPVKKTRQESQDSKEGHEWLNKGNRRKFRATSSAIS
jgi:hypothetical protein